MSAITVEARSALAIPKDLEDDQRRSAGTLAGDRGSTFAETTFEGRLFQDRSPMGFEPPAVRKARLRLVPTAGEQAESNSSAGMSEHIGTAGESPSPDQPTEL